MGVILALGILVTFGHFAITAAIAAGGFVLLLYMLVQWDDLELKWSRLILAFFVAFVVAVVAVFVMNRWVVPLWW